MPSEWEGPLNNVLQVLSRATDPNSGLSWDYICPLFVPAAADMLRGEGPFANPEPCSAPPSAKCVCHMRHELALLLVAAQNMSAASGLPTDQMWGESVNLLGDIMDRRARAN